MGANQETWWWWYGGMVPYIRYGWHWYHHMPHHTTLDRQAIMATRTVSAIEASVRRLQALHINFVGVDFDQTIIDIHTGGRWNGTPDELVTHVRPEFKQLLPALLHNQISVAVVTFSPQTKLIQHVLETIVGPEQAARIPIRGGDKTWTYSGAGSKAGKQAHMASAVEELEQDGSIHITRGSAVLIDDDVNNIRHSLKNGVRGVWLNPSKPHHLFRDLKNLE